MQRHPRSRAIFSRVRIPQTPPSQSNFACRPQHAQSTQHSTLMWPPDAWLTRGIGLAIAGALMAWQTAFRVFLDALHGRRSIRPLIV
jgi:hypothetical protein